MKFVRKQLVQQSLEQFVEKKQYVATRAIICPAILLIEKGENSLFACLTSHLTPSLRVY